MPTGNSQRTGRARRVPTKPDTFDPLRQKMIRETELGLTFGLRFPDQVPRIPTIEVGAAAFAPFLVEHYWIERLELDRQESTKRKRWWRLI